MITVGLDFGTHQTKVCVERKERAELEYSFIKFPDSRGQSQYTLPSIISIQPDGKLRYGYLPDNDNGKRWGRLPIPDIFTRHRKWPSVSFPVLMVSLKSCSKGISRSFWTSR